MYQQYNKKLLYRYQSYDDNKQTINIDILFNDPNFYVGKLIENDKIVLQTKKQNQKITILLIRRTDILQQLMEICLRPHYYHNAQLGIINNQHTNRALEILTSLTQLFVDYLIQQPNQGISQSNAGDDDNVITQQIDQKQKISWKQQPMVTQLFKLLNDKKPIQQTPLGYMLKIGTPVCYQKPKKIIQLFRNKQVCMMMFEHFYSNTILQWVIKLIEMDDSGVFFEVQKIIKNENNIEFKLPKYQNYLAIINTLQQKMVDKYDKNKFVHFIKNFIMDKLNIQFIVDQGIKYILNVTQNQFIPTQLQQRLFDTIILIVQKYLHFGSKYRANLLVDTGNTSIIIIKDKSGPNIGNTFGISSQGIGLDASTVLQQKVLQSIVLDVQIEQKIKRLIRLYIINQNKIQIQASHENMSSKIAMLQLIKTSLIVQPLANSQLQYISEILNQKYVRYLLKQFKINISCNIIHNIIKDIFIYAIQKCYQYFSMLLLFNTQFVQMFRSGGGKINSINNQYQNQLFLIFKVLNRKGEEAGNIKTLQNIRKQLKGYQQLELIMKQKQQLYSTLIGGNPRKQSSCLNDSSQDQKIISVNFNNQGLGDKVNNSSSNQQQILNQNGGGSEEIDRNVNVLESIDDDIPLTLERYLMEQGNCLVKSVEIHQVNKSPENEKIVHENQLATIQNQQKKITQQKCSQQNNVIKTQKENKDIQKNQEIIKVQQDKNTIIKQDKINQNKTHENINEGKIIQDKNQQLKISIHLVDQVQEHQGDEHKIQEKKIGENNGQCQKVENSQKQNKGTCQQKKQSNIQNSQIINENKNSQIQANKNQNKQQQSCEKPKEI